MSGVARLLEESRLPRAADYAPPDGVRGVYLHAGQLHASAEPTQVTTILGSCVALCLWDPFARVGGLNHFMLPIEAGSQTETPRYARFAIEELVRQMDALGARLARMQAKLFGGACVLPSMQAVTRDLGARNIDVAREWLERQRITLVAEDVGGQTGRKLIFRTDTGATTVRRIDS